MRKADRPEIESLLDATIGRGFWDPARDLDDQVLVAIQGNRVVGVASASVEPRAEEAPTGQVRLVAVDRSARRCGIATELLRQTVSACESKGARDLVAYAWVHHDIGIAPLSTALVRSGFLFESRIERFYSAALAPACPACGESPCICSADLYRRRGAAPSG